MCVHAEDILLGRITRALLYGMKLETHNLQKVVQVSRHAIYTFIDITH